MVDKILIDKVLREEEGPLIARIWHGRVPAGKAARYLELMRTVAIPDYSATPGNRGAYALSRTDGDEVDFVMLTFWADRKSIAAFAGEPIERAKYYDFDHEFLLAVEPVAAHYEVFDR